MPLSPEKDLRICRFLTGWDSLEQRSSGNAIVDFNIPCFTDEHADTRYASRQAVLEELKELQQDGEIKADKRVSQKLRAQEAYLHTLIEGSSDFTSYIESTLGFTPRLFSEDALMAQRARIEKALDPFGIKVDQDLEKRFSEIQEEIPQNQLEAFYLSSHNRTNEALSPIIGAIPDFALKVEFANVDAYWKNWVDGGRKEYRLRFNERNISRYNHIEMTMYSLHEVSAHINQAVILYDKIQSGVVPQCMGMTTLHGPEIFQLEGLAMTLPYFIQTEDTQLPLLQAKREMYIYDQMVDKNNAHIMVNTGSSIEESADYTTKYMPYADRDKIAHGLNSSVKDPQMRCAQHVYGASAAFFQEFALKSNDAQKQAFLARIYHDWMPADELVKFTQELRSPKADYGAPGPKKMPKPGLSVFAQE